MKKTPFITINLRKSAYFMKAAIFISAVAVTCGASRFVRPIDLGNDITNALISSCCVVCTDQTSVRIPGAFFRAAKNKAEEKSVSVKRQKTKAASAVPTAEKIKAVVNTAPPQKVSVSNDTKSTLDIDALTVAPPNFLNKKNSVLIMHTHTSESYTPSDAYSYVPTDSYRTLDKNYNMVHVGKEIKQVLEKNGIKVYHDTTVNDYPSYNGSYNRSGVNVQNFIKNDPSINIVLDIHRDAIEGSDGTKIKHICSIDKKNAACVMFVVGSNLSGLAHDNWKSNMSFALLLQKHINTMYPDLCRPVNFRKQRFNQQLAPGALIVEVGTNANTLEEALLGASCFAKGLSDFLNK